MVISSTDVFFYMVPLSVSDFRSFLNDVQYLSCFILLDLSPNIEGWNFFRLSMDTMKFENPIQ
jgi:hypothetical protein